MTIREELVECLGKDQLALFELKERMVANHKRPHFGGVLYGMIEKGEIEVEDVEVEVEEGKTKQVRAFRYVGGKETAPKGKPKAGQSKSAAGGTKPPKAAKAPAAAKGKTAKAPQEARAKRPLKASKRRSRAS